MNKLDKILKKICESPAFLPLCFLSYDFTLLCFDGPSISAGIRYRLIQLRDGEHGLRKEQSVETCQPTSAGDSK